LKSTTKLISLFCILLFEISCSNFNSSTISSSNSQHDHPAGGALRAPSNMEFIDNVETHNPSPNENQNETQSETQSDIIEAPLVVQLPSTPQPPQAHPLQQQPCEEYFSKSTVERLHFKEGDHIANANDEAIVQKGLHDFVADFLKKTAVKNPEIEISTLSINASASHTPFFSKGKIAANSNKKNEALAAKRLQTAKKVLFSLVRDRELYAEIKEVMDVRKLKTQASSTVNGPPWTNTKANFNLRNKSSNFVINPEYEFKNERYGVFGNLLFAMYEKDYQKFGISSAEQLMREFPDAYDAKFKPFQVFLITIEGKKKVSCSQVK